MKISLAYWILPLLLALAAAPFISAWDMAIARSYFDTSSNTFPESPFQLFLYNYATWPGFALCVGGGAIYIFSYKIPQLQPARLGALVVCLTFALGAVFVINCLFKEFWGRPRPRQLAEFGGNEQFHPFYQADISRRDVPRKSFPSGHAANGFSYLSLYFIGRRYRIGWLKVAGLVLTVIMGLLLSWVRIAVGGHFLSDTFFAAIIMWYTALLLDHFILKKRVQT